MIEIFNNKGYNLIQLKRKFLKISIIVSHLFQSWKLTETLERKYRQSNDIQHFNVTMREVQLWELKRRRRRSNRRSELRRNKRLQLRRCCIIRFQRQAREPAIRWPGAGQPSTWEEVSGEGVGIVWLDCRVRNLQSQSGEHGLLRPHQLCDRSLKRVRVFQSLCNSLSYTDGLPVDLVLGLQPTSWWPVWLMRKWGVTCEGKDE